MPRSASELRQSTLRVSQNSTSGERERRKGEVVVAQLVERSLLITEVRGSTPVIGIIYIEHLLVNLFIINCIEKTKINKRGKELPNF